MTAELIRVLVLDDDEAQLSLVERALSRDGFDVRGVSTLEALQQIGPSFAPHLVLVDMNMPDVPSGEAIAAARSAAQSARVVIYSAWDESRLRLMAQQLGADGYLSKAEPVFSIGPRLAKLATAPRG